MVCQAARSRVRIWVLIGSIFLDRDGGGLRNGEGRDGGRPGPGSGLRQRAGDAAKAR
nr:hypothetical protein GCM10010200_064230 [Actinomadura rugatobispora]